MQTLQEIKKRGCGVIIYGYDEGRGIGLENKIASMGFEQKYKINTIEAFRKLGYGKSDYRNYAKEVQALDDLAVNKQIHLVSCNPEKEKALELAGYKIRKFLKLKIKLNKYNKGEMTVKRDKMNYYID